MMWKQKFITAKAVTYYFRIVQRDLRLLREKLKGTPYIKKSTSRCSGVKGKYYYLYDMEYLVDVLKVRPVYPIPERLIQ